MNLKCLFGLHDWEKLPISLETKEVWNKCYEDIDCPPDIELIDFGIKNRICLKCGKKDMIFDKYITKVTNEKIRRKKKLDELLKRYDCGQRNQRE